jgi:micrococcal nuclease
MKPLSLAIAVTLLAACGEVNNDREDAGFFTRDSGTTSMTDSGTRPTGTILVDVVYDGDTIRVRAGSTVRTPDGRPMNEEHVRLLGIDAPEIAHPEATPPTEAECWGDNAAQAAQMLIGGKIIELEFDPEHTLRDGFNRLLAYVRLDDDRVANEVLIREGHARSFRAFPHRDTEKYNALEAQARDANLGMWSCP